MNLKIVPIGNSLGVRIPQAILMQLNIKKEVSIEVDDNSIKLRPIRNKVRENWNHAFKQMSEAKGNSPLIPDILNDFDKNEWEW